MLMKLDAAETSAEGSGDSASPSCRRLPRSKEIGRHKVSGAPLGEQQEFDPIDLQARRDGSPVIPADAYVRLASPDDNAGQRILRRGCSYAGFRSARCRSLLHPFPARPERQFVPIQRRLASSGALNRHTLHTTSALFACQPGTKRGGFIGEGLFV